MKKYLLLAFGLLFLLQAKATHFRGIEMVASNVGDKSYVLYVDLYTRASSPAPTLTLTLDWGTSGASDTLLLDTAAGTVDPATDLRIYHVIRSHTFPGDGNYQVTATVANWEAGILNITDAVNTPFTGYIDIIISPFLGANHFDGYNYNQTYGTQVGNDFYQDLSWTEPDGDSVVVEQQIASELAVPATYQYPASLAGGTEYIWDQVYHFDNIPMQGLYVVSFRTKEYRHGVLVGSQLREFSFMYNDAVAGLHEMNNSENTPSLYPNPCHNTIYVNTLQTQTLSICDIHGKTLLSATTKQPVDVSALQPGIYLVKTQNRKVLKLVKE